MLTNIEKTNNLTTSYYSDFKYILITSETNAFSKEICEKILYHGREDIFIVCLDYDKNMGKHLILHYFEGCLHFK
jgi:phosphopantetheine adenylyltransferase